MTQTIKIRASSLPLISLCTASTVEVGPVLGGGSNDAADLGTAVHEALAIAIAKPNEFRRTADVCDLAAQSARAHGVDVDDARQMAAWGWKAWESVRSHFPDPQPEVEMRFEEHGLVLTGHADVLSTLPDEVRVLDFKTGRVDADPAEQVKGYCWLALQDNPGATGAYGASLRTRDQIIDGAHYTRDELASWWGKLSKRMHTERALYRPGRWCGQCSRGLTCPAKTLMLAQAAKMLGAEWSAGRTPDERGELFDMAKLIVAQAEAAIELLRAETEANGGRLSIGDGRELRLTDQQRRTIEPEVGLPVLRTMLSEEEIYGAMKISKTACEDAVKAGAGRGAKAAAARELCERLEAAEAFNVQTITKLEVKRVGASQPAALAHN